MVSSTASGKGLCVADLRAAASHHMDKMTEGKAPLSDCSSELTGFIEFYNCGADDGITVEDNESLQLLQTTCPLVPG